MAVVRAALRTLSRSSESNALAVDALELQRQPRKRRTSAIAQRCAPARYDASAHPRGTLHEHAVALAKANGSSGLRTGARRAARPKQIQGSALMATSLRWCCRSGCAPAAAASRLAAAAAGGGSLSGAASSLCVRLRLLGQRRGLGRLVLAGSVPGRAVSRRRSDRRTSTALRSAAAAAGARRAAACTLALACWPAAGRGCSCTSRSSRSRRAAPSRRIVGRMKTIRLRLVLVDGCAS